LKIGECFNQYEIIKQIGAGGMGEVYLAIDKKLDRKVAVKILNEKFAQHESNLRRFTQEAKAASALNHPNILVIHEIGEADDVHFIVSEFVEGKTLREILDQSPLKLSEVLAVSIQIAGALTAAHAANIVHRDIKPDNIIIRPDDYVKILDFGLAKLVEQQKSLVGLEDETAKQNQTAKGVILGTVKYMSPEQAKGEKVDGRTDIFSFGVLLYEMMAGRTPFAGNSVSETLANLINAVPQPMARYAEGVPNELQRIVSKMLRKNKDERYQTMKGLLADLKDLRENLAFDERLEKSHPPGAENATQILQTTTGDANLQTAKMQDSFSQTIKRHKPLAAFVLIVLLAAIGFGVWYFTNRVANTKQIESIAVLPFINENGNADVEYLSDGMTETLISSLSQLPDLNVKARSSVFRYKGKEIDAQTIGKELNVQAILNGTVVRRGEDLALHIELVDAQTETVLWSADYRQPMTNLVSLQSEITRDVSNKLRMKLSGADEKRLKKNQTENTEAYQLYLLGRYHLNKLTDDGFRKGRDYFQQAIEIDPNYALAYAGLADAYIKLSGYNALPPNEGFPKARAAATKALELDDQLAEAHIILGAVKHFYDWDWLGAEREFKRAIEINPSNADARQFYSYHLSAMGRFDEALSEMKRAQELDPLSLEKIVGIGEIFYYQRQYDRAIEQYRKALEMDSNSGFTHWAIGNVYVQKGMYQEAIAEYQKAIPLSGDSPDEPASLAYTYALLGRRQEALRIIDDLKERSKRSYISPSTMAFIYIGLAEKNQAFELLDKAYNERDILLVLLKVEPMFDPLRSDPRFQDLLRRVGLPP
jgi:serine/threonine-protein kinase